MEAYLDTSLSFAKRAEDLVSRMTTEEKIAQILSAAHVRERVQEPARAPRR